MTDQRSQAEGWRARAVLLGLGLVTVLLTAAVLLGFTSLQSVYRGDPSPAGDASTAPSVAARVGACTRSGPVSSHGYGYWWTCDVTLTFAGGRQVRTALAPSTVTPADRARPPVLVEHCQHRHFTGCRYSRTGGSATVAFLLLLVGRVLFFAGAVVALVAGVPILRGLLGQRLLLRYFSRAPKPPATHEARPADGVPVAAAGPPPAGEREVATGRVLVAVVILYAAPYVAYLAAR